MITSDHPLTAETIARQVGVHDADGLSAARSRGL